MIIKLILSLLIATAIVAAIDITRSFISKRRIKNINSRILAFASIFFSTKPFSPEQGEPFSCFLTEKLNLKRVENIKIDVSESRMRVSYEYTISTRRAKIVRLEVERKA